MVKIARTTTIPTTANRKILAEGKHGEPPLRQTVSTTIQTDESDSDSPLATWSSKNPTGSRSNISQTTNRAHIGPQGASSHKTLSTIPTAIKPTRPTFNTSSRASHEAFTPISAKADAWKSVGAIRPLGRRMSTTQTNDAQQPNQTTHEPEPAHPVDTPMKGATMESISQQDLPMNLDDNMDYQPPEAVSGDFEAFPDPVDFMRTAIEEIEQAIPSVSTSFITLKY